MEINQASRAELESLSGLGPALVERILLARSQAPFKDWDDLRRRVRGIGEPSAQKLSTQGLRVAGLAYTKAEVSLSNEAVDTPAQTPPSR
ncbi:ComEA family DNA-binding protein [Roseateles sp.]|uniref:ComEA family DNA-binding protein n=1 Tax=Roseateles sp. TaxID=1971397 RepID=UPI003BA6ED47